MSLPFPPLRALSIVLCVCALVLTSGCFGVRLSREARAAKMLLDEANRDFLSIKEGMTVAEVEERLGPPDQTDRSGIRHWKREQQVSRRLPDILSDSTELKVKFNREGRVSEINTETEIVQAADS